MLEKLNSPQKEAVLHTEGPLLILAGAGSGKTRVLIHRMIHLLQGGSIKPWNILAVTFTNKAAGEMRERIEKVLGPQYSRTMWISTFHSACLRILKEHASLIQYQRDFSIYDDKDQLQVINQCYEELKLNPKVLNPKVVQSRINRSKNEGGEVYQHLRMGPDFIDEKVIKIYDLYQQKLLQNQAMDFGDLIYNTVRLFKENDDVLQHYQSQFQYIHVDEFQDTNRIQYELIDLLSRGHGNLCVVGDDDQSIYSFRGAEVSNILDFQKDYPEAKSITLDQNYRSTKNILSAASALVARNKRRMTKTLWTENSEGDLINLYEGLTEKDEADYVVQEIAKWKESRAYNDVAIFYRTNAQSRSFEEKLRRSGVPYVIFGGMRFYDRQEIKDIMAYLRVLVNPHDSVSLKRIINVPLRGIGKTSIQKLEYIAQEESVSLWQALETVTQKERAGISSALFKKLQGFVQLIYRLKKLSKELDLQSFVMELYKETSYWKFYEDQGTLEAEARLENLKEFVNVVAEYQLSEEAPSLEGFLDQTSLMTALDGNEESQDRVTLMTLHLAKGLEFPLVFLVGLEEGLFPHSRSLEADDSLEEERRLCYVGMTRAEEKLHLSHVSQRNLFGNSQFHIPSRFLDEIPSDKIEKIESQAKQNLNQFVSQDLTDSSEATIQIKDSFSDFPRGCKIKHPVFGFGTVKQSESSPSGEKLTITFSNGQTKKILTKYTQLEKY